MDRDKEKEIETRFESLDTGRQQKFIRYLDYLDSVDHQKTGGR